MIVDRGIAWTVIVRTGYKDAERRIVLSPHPEDYELVWRTSEAKAYHTQTLPRIGERVDLFLNEGLPTSYEVREIIHDVRRSPPEPPCLILEAIGRDLTNLKDFPKEER